MKKNLTFILLFLISCSIKEKKFQKETTVLKNINIKYRNDSLLTKKIYLVTGLDGCGACLDYTVKFVEENINDKNMNFIISGQSKVQLKSKFTNKSILNNNFVFDTAQIASRSGIIGISKPKIFLCNLGSVYDIKEVDFKNADSIFAYVKDYIKR